MNFSTKDPRSVVLQPRYETAASESADYFKRVRP